MWYMALVRWFIWSCAGGFPSRNIPLAPCLNLTLFSLRSTCGSVGRIPTLQVRICDLFYNTWKISVYIHIYIYIYIYIYTHAHIYIYIYRSTAIHASMQI